MTVQSGHLHHIFDPNSFPDIVRRSKKTARRIMKAHPFKAIAFTGVSGAAIAFILADYLKLPMYCVRKPDDSTHSYHSIEGKFGKSSYLLVDDFIESGETVRQVSARIKRFCPSARMVAIMLHKLDWEKSVLDGTRNLAQYQKDQLQDHLGLPRVPVYGLLP